MTIVSGTGLPAMDLNGFSDPYCQVFQNSLKLKTTPFVLKSLNPVWNTPVDIITSNYSNVRLDPLNGIDVLTIFQRHPE